MTYATVSSLLVAFILSLVVVEYKPVMYGGCLKDLKTYADRNTTFQVETLRYLSPKSHSTILIIPPTGGVNFLDKSYARYLCRKGFNAIILKKWTHDDEVNYDLGIHQRFYERTQKAISLVLEQTPNTSFGILGTSVGGIHASVAIKLHKKLKAAFIIVGGAPIASVIAHSNQKAMIEAKAKRFEMFNFKSTEEYESALSKEILLDPFKLTANEEKKVAMVLAENDLTVPSKLQNKLKENLNPEQVFNFSNNHFWTIIKSWLFLKPNIAQFFNHTLND